MNFHARPDSEQKKPLEYTWTEHFDRELRAFVQLVIDY